MEQLAELIQVKLVESKNRHHILPKVFGRLFPNGESLLYRMAENFSNDYKGGYWDFYELSNGAYYFAPTSEETYKVEITDNWFSGEPSADAFGLICTLFVCSHLSNYAYAHKLPYESMSENYHLLMDFVSEHSESDLIFRAID